MKNLGLHLWLWLGVILFATGLSRGAWALETQTAPETTQQKPLESLVIGVAPHASVNILINDYQPLRRFLQDALQRKVIIVTAPDFDEFLRRALAGRYGVAITTAHQARLMQTDTGSLPLLTYMADFSCVLLAARSGKITQAKDIEGGVVVGLGKSSLTTIWGMQWLRDQHVEQFTQRYVSASDNIAHWVLEGNAGIGLMSQAGFDRLKPEVQAKLHILARSPLFAGRVYMLNPREAAEKERILAALEAFSKTPEAQAYFARTKLMGYRPLNSGELEMMEPYAQLLRRLSTQPADEEFVP
jgi:phosphonate transport system substrate-binding protein